MDPLVELLLDPKVVQVASTLVAKLEHIRYDETRRGVFRTLWGRQLFSSASRRLMRGSSDFDVDEWFDSVITRNAPDRGDKFEFSPSKILQDVDTNWLAPLLELEMRTPKFIMLLHNCLEIEDLSHEKLAEKSKKEDQYDLLGLGFRNKAIERQLLISGASSSVRPAITHQ
jgi:hypothetical protein